MDTVNYVFYDCEDCVIGYAVEETPDTTEEPVCPACGCDRARLVGVVEMPMPLPVK